MLNTVFIVDPVLSLTNLTREKSIPNVVTISLGNQAQLDAATKALKSSSERGTWLILQNCHLVENWSRSFIKQLMVG